VKWLQQGAQPTDRVRKLLEISGALEQFSASKVKA
jgi:small subunit ribosomal protein S16